MQHSSSPSVRRMEQLDQPLAHARLDLGAVARDLYLAIRVPGVAQAAGAVEGHSFGRAPLDAERAPNRLEPGLGRLFHHVASRALLAAAVVFLLRRVGLPEDRAARRVIDDPPVRRRGAGRRGRHAQGFGFRGDVLGSGGRL